jgi:hypothetical protein
VAWRVGPHRALAGVIVGRPAVSGHEFPSVWGSHTAAASSANAQARAGRARAGTVSRHDVPEHRRHAATFGHARQVRRPREAQRHLAWLVAW